MRARPLVRQWGLRDTVRHLFITLFIPPCSQRRRVSTDVWHYGGLRIVIVSRIAEDRPFHCGIRANIRSTELIRAKIRSIYISDAHHSRSYLLKGDLWRICENYNNHWVHFNALGSALYNSVKKKNVYKRCMYYTV